jgi:DNA-binding transcriptional regulator YhcF (GntR family)
MERQAQIRIDLNDPTPAYRQIVEGLRALLVEGRLRPGDALPTVRELAIELGVHFNTVAEAYRILADEGWLELKRRRGAVVIDRASRKAAPEAGDGFARRLRQLIAEVRAEGVPIRRIKQELQNITERLDS